MFITLEKTNQHRSKLTSHGDKESITKYYLGNERRETSVSLRSRTQSEVKERSDDGSGELLPYPDGEAHGASDAADFFGVGAGIDQSSDLLQICRGERAIDFKNPSERVKRMRIEICYYAGELRWWRRRWIELGFGCCLSSPRLESSSSSSRPRISEIFFSVRRGEGRYV